MPPPDLLQDYGASLLRRGAGAVADHEGPGCGPARVAGPAADGENAFAALVCVRLAPPPGLLPVAAPAVLGVTRGQSDARVPRADPWCLPGPDLRAVVTTASLPFDLLGGTSWTGKFGPACMVFGNRGGPKVVCAGAGLCGEAVGGEPASCAGVLEAKVIHPGSLPWASIVKLNALGSGPLPRCGAAVIGVGCGGVGPEFTSVSPGHPSRRRVVVAAVPILGHGVGVLPEGPEVRVINPGFLP